MPMDRAFSFAVGGYPWIDKGDEDDMSSFLFSECVFANSVYREQSSSPRDHQTEKGKIREEEAA
jgi:hypothetical protein